MDHDVSPACLMDLSTEPSVRRPLHGFTLVELLVVIAIIGVLLAMLVPAVGGVRESSRQTQCLNNLKQLGIAAQSYESSNGVFPPGVEDHPDTTSTNEANWGWLALILPQLEQQTVYDALQVHVTNLEDMVGSMPAVPNSKFASAGTQPISVFLCPSFGIPTKSDDAQNDCFKINVPVVSGVAFAPTHYAASNGVDRHVTNGSSTGSNGALSIGLDQKGLGRSAARITDGLSSTLMAGEVGRKPLGSTDNDPTYLKWVGCNQTPGGNSHCQRNARTVWYAPNQLTDHKNKLSFGSTHAGGGAQFVFCDGSTRRIDDTINCGTESSTISFPILYTSPPALVGQEQYGVYQKLGNIRDARPISEF